MAISFRRGNNADGSGTGIACAFSACTAGDLLVVSIGWVDPAGTITCSVPTDSAGNAYAVAAAKVRNTSTGFALQTFYAYGVKSSGANTVTFALSGSSSFITVSVEEWKSSNGPWTSNPFDQTNSATGSSKNLSSGTVTPTANNELIYGWCNTNSGTVTAAGSFHLRESVDSGFGAAVDLVQTAKAAVAATASSTVSDQWVMQAATFKDVTGSVASATPSASARTRPSVAASTAKARPLMAGGAFVSVARLMPSLRRSEVRQAPIAAYFWQSGPTPVVDIPITWLSGQLGWRLEPPRSKAQVSSSSAATARSVNRAAFAEYRSYIFGAELSTACDADAANLAHFVTTYYPDARMRLVNMTVSLLPLTDTQRRLLLGIGLGRRIRPTGIPPEWPVDAQTLVVSGIRHTVGTRRRLISFTTDPVVDQTWFRHGVSSYGGTDARLW